MKEDAIGHIFPCIDEEKCINCGLCKRICPGNHNFTLNNPKNVYAAWSLNEHEHETCTSGGIATFLSRKVLETGGVVYGCSSVFNKEDQVIHHIRIDSLTDLHLLRGSKYVHSYIGKCYTHAKNDLENGRQVVFVGTPCQIAGLDAFLQKKYSNLLNIDLICHGVPSQKMLKENLNDKSLDAPYSISFREKQGFVLRVFNNTGDTLYQRKANKDHYYLGFSSSLFYRDSCYECAYAKSARCGDMTLGDFWGLGREQPFEHSLSNGVSLVMINSTKGELFFSNHCQGIFFERRSLHEAVSGNANLRRPSKRHRYVMEFRKLYPKTGFIASVNRCLRWEKFKYSVLSALQRYQFSMRLVARIRNLWRTE